MAGEQATAADIVKWIEDLWVPEGRLLGQKFKLADWQISCLESIYDNPHGTRRAILSFSRKCGKSTLCALLLLVHLCGPRARPNSQLYSTAQSREQAAVIFNLAAKIARMSPALRDFVTVRDSTKELLCPSLGTRYRTLSADASTAYGLSPSLTIHDELGQCRGPQTIALANPALGSFLNEREVMAMAEDARRMPAREAEFRNLILNQRVEACNPFLQPALWQACAGEVADISGRECYAGLDLSEVRDLTALVVISKVDGIWQMVPTFWLPREGIYERAHTDHIPYDKFVEQGFVRTTPGASISYEYVAHYLLKVFAQYNIRKIGFDRWNFRHLKPWLMQAGFSEQLIADRWVEFGQGTQSMSPALRELESIVLERQLCHGDNPVMNMCAVNAVVEGKDASNRKLSKNKSAGRIDGLVALAMAIGVAPLRAPAFDIEALIG